MFDSEWDDDDLNLDEIFSNSARKTSSEKPHEPRQSRSINESVSIRSCSSTGSTQPRSVLGDLMTNRVAADSKADGRLDDASGELFVVPVQETTKSSSRQNLKRSAPSDPIQLTSTPDNERRDFTPQKSTSDLSEERVSRSSYFEAILKRRSSSPSREASNPKRRKSRFPGPAGRIQGVGSATAPNESTLNESHDVVDKEASLRDVVENSPRSDDEEGDCRATWASLMSSLSSFSPGERPPSSAKDLLNAVNLGWLSRDLLFGTQLPDEKAPLLAFMIRAADVGVAQTLLRMTDEEKNEMTGLTWNASVDPALLEKLVPGTSVLLKDASTGSLGHTLVSQYVVVTGSTIARVAYVDPEERRVRLFVSDACDVAESDFRRLRHVYAKSISSSHDSTTTTTTTTKKSRSDDVVRDCNHSRDPHPRLSTDEAGSASQRKFNFVKSVSKSKSAKETRSPDDAASDIDPVTLSQMLDDDF